MKKRLASLLMALVMVLGLLPTAALAAGGDSVKVDFTAQAEGAFLLAPQFGVEVSGNLAETYGYSDSVTGGVSALDVLVKAHELCFEDFADANTDYLVVDDSGFITTVFGEVTYNFSFAVNGEMPNDGELKEDSYAPGGQSYTGYSIGQAAVESGDMLEFFLYQDAYALDNYVWFEQNGSKCAELTVKPESRVSLTAKGYCIGWYGCVPMTALITYHQINTIDSVQLAWVNTETGALEDIDGSVTDENGTAAVTMPKAEGVYYLTAYMPPEEITENYATPVVLPLLKVTVDENAQEPEEPTYGPCDLTALSVTDFDGNPNPLTLTPAFSSDVTAYSVAQVAYQSAAYLRMAYVKATAASDSAVITAECNGVSAQVTSGDAYWKALSNALRPGEDNLLTVTVAASEAADAETKTYTVTIPMAPDPTAPTLAGEAAGTASIQLGGSYTLDLSAVFNDTDTPKENLTYTVSVDGADPAAADASYSFTPAQAGTHTLVFRASDGTNSSPAYTVTLAVVTDASITVPSDATVYVGRKDYSGYNYRPFTELEAVYVQTDGDTTTYYYNLTSGKEHTYRISGEDYVTYVGKVKKSGEWSLTVSKADLQPEGKTKTTVDHDVTSNNGCNVGDIYLNINAQGYLKMAAVDDTYQLISLRNWQAIDGFMSNYFIEPDYHYTVLDETGAESSDVVTVDEDGVIRAVGEGTAIVLVTYDAMYNSCAGDSNGFLGAIWPENTGVFVVSVGAEDSGITTGMTINDGRNTADASKRSGDALDAEHDVIYYVGESGSYTFTPETAGCAVSVANPTVTDVMGINGFTAVDANADGSFTVPLVQGRNIVKLEKDGKAEYQVITAKKVNVTINNGEAVHPGDTLSIKFDTLYHPANKLSGIYNLTATALYEDVDGYDGKYVGVVSNQYKFASTATAQTVVELEKKSTFMGTTYAQKAVLQVPEDYAADTFTLSGGSIAVVGFGDEPGNHRGITLEVGKDPNLTAGAVSGVLGRLPDIEIPIVVTDAELASISLTTDGVRTAYYAGDAFDTANLVVTAHYADGKTQTATNYTVTPSVLTADTTEVTITYRGKSAVIPVTVTQLKVTAIAVTTAPNKTSYTAGDIFDPTGMVVTATYDNGKTAPVTSYTYAPNRVLRDTDTAMTITYTGDDAAESVAPVQQAITVAPAAEDPSQPTTQTITVYFTLLGDEHHDPEEGTHTLKAGNLDTWIRKTGVEVKKGSKVIDVLSKALSLAGIPYENPTGNYVSEIKGLAEFDNGELSGWMYTLNGTHPNLGVAEQTVKNGDVIIFHYTDDYTVEEGSEKWTSSGSSVPNAIDKVESLIDAIGTVTENSGKKIEAAREAYDALTSAQKKLVSNYKVLTDAEAAYAALTGALPFTDVKETDFCYDAVKWAVEQGITTGTTDTTFSPGAGCTRAQMVTFLWRAAGSPKPAGKDCSFTDVEEDAYYYQALLWAMEHGITTGTTDTTFSPGAACTRGQMAAFLYRYAKTPAVEGENPFIDVQESDYFYTAVLWALQEGVTKGTTDTTFSPGSVCTRSQMVTFLCRYLAE